MSQTVETPPVEEGRELRGCRTRVAQCLAHPLRSFGRSLPWWAVPSLARDRGCVLWEVRRKVDG